MGYANMSSAFVYKKVLFATQLDALGENDSYLKRNGWADSTKAIFYQASVPTGWTLVSGLNDRFLRVVNNAGGNVGGITGGSTLVSSGIFSSHPHTMSAEGTHTHTILVAHQHNMGTGGTSSSLGTNFPTAIGNVVNSQFVSTSGSGSQSVWSKYFNPTAKNVNPTNAGGAHGHTINSNGTVQVPAFVDVIIGSKDSSSGYTDMTTFFSHLNKTDYDPFANELWDNDEFNKGRLTPSGSVMIFYQSGAPAGWTKLATQNDKALRVVSGAGGGSGGAVATSAALVLAHNHTVVAGGAHTHTTGTHQHDVNINATLPTVYSGVFYYVIASGGYLVPTNNDGTVQNAIKGQTTAGAGGITTSDPGSHANSISNSLSNITLAYADIIQCSKNSGGAPYAYQDLSARVDYEKLTSKQRLNDFGKNDAYLKYHTIPATSLALFYQSAIPISWSLSTAQHDKVLRIVSGAGGGAGGSHLISSTITLAHTHPIGTLYHDHTFSHGHSWDTNNQAAGAIIANRVLMNPSANEVHIGDTAGALGTRITDSINSATGLLNSLGHNHGGTTSSALSNTTFAYANVILCSKDV